MMSLGWAGQAGPVWQSAHSEPLLMTFFPRTLKSDTITSSLQRRRKLSVNQFQRPDLTRQSKHSWWMKIKGQITTLKTY